MHLFQTCWPCGQRKSGRRWDRGSVTCLKMKLWPQSSIRCCQPWFDHHAISRELWHFTPNWELKHFQELRSDCVCAHACVCISQDQPAVAAHCFKEGMKLEAVDPAAPISIRPATVTKVTDFPISFDSPVLQSFCHVYCFGLSCLCSLPRSLLS